MGLILSTLTRPCWPGGQIGFTSVGILDGSEKNGKVSKSENSFFPTWKDFQKHHSSFFLKCLATECVHVKHYLMRLQTFFKIIIKRSRSYLDNDCSKNSNQRTTRRLHKFLYHVHLVPYVDFWSVLSITEQSICVIERTDQKSTYDTMWP